MDLCASTVFLKKNLPEIQNSATYLSLKNHGSFNSHLGVRVQLAPNPHIQLTCGNKGKNRAVGKPVPCYMTCPFKIILSMFVFQYTSRRQPAQ